MCHGLFAKKLGKIHQMWPQRLLEHFTAAYRGFPPCTQSQHPINRETGYSNVLVTPWPVALPCLPTLLPASYPHILIYILISSYPHIYPHILWMPWLVALPWSNPRICLLTTVAIVVKHQIPGQIRQKSYLQSIL